MVKKIDDKLLQKERDELEKSLVQARINVEQAKIKYKQSWVQFQ